VSSALLEGRPIEAGSVKRVAAPAIEQAVLRAAAERSERDRSGFYQRAEEHEISAREMVKLNVNRVELTGKEIRLTFPQSADAAPEIMAVPWTPSVPTRRREVLLPANTDPQSPRSPPIRAETRARLIEGIARARSWVAELTAGKSSDTHQIATREGLSERSVRMTLQLAFLSPAIVRKAIDGSLSRSFGTVRLAKIALSWDEQLCAPGS